MGEYINLGGILLQAALARTDSKGLRQPAWLPGCIVSDEWGREESVAGGAELSFNSAVL